MRMVKILIGFALVLSFQAQQSFADEEIICRVKGSGQKVFRLDSGMLMMFDNIRVLHGRTEYDVNTGFRHLQGCYIDHDSTEGKLRRLKSIL